MIRSSSAGESWANTTDSARVFRYCSSACKLIGPLRFRVMAAPRAARQRLDGGSIVEEESGGSRAGVLLRLYARWLPREAPLTPGFAPVRTPAAPDNARAAVVGKAGYPRTQNPCDSIPSGTLNLLRFMRPSERSHSWGMSV